MTTRTSTSLRQAIACVSAMCFVLLAGISCLPQPFEGDQSLFAMGAERCLSGSVYFRDFWDLKPPGIYWFYAIGGYLFSFDEAGIHLLELIWSIAFALMLSRCAQSWYRTTVARASVPLITVGVYYSVADTWHLTQVEWIVAFPLFVSMWCMNSSSPGRVATVSAFLTAGVCGGTVALFKPLYGLIPAAMWLCAVIPGPFPEYSKKLQYAVSRGIAFAIGVLIPLSAAALYFQSHGALDIALKTMFEYPAKILASKNDGIGMLLQGLKWCALMAGPLMALGLAGIFYVVRTERSSFGISLTVWTIIGLVLVLIQGMWWEYHYLLILTPLALLALKAMDVFAEHLHVLQCNVRDPLNKGALILCIALLFSAYPAMLLYRIALLSKYGFALSAENRMAYQSVRHLEYQTARTETEFLHDPKAIPGDIYIFGNPIGYRFAGRRQAIPQQGWSIKVYLPEQWTEIENNLRTAKPAYVFVALNKQQQIAERKTTIPSLLSERYHILRQSANGIWYELTKQTNDIRISLRHRRDSSSVGQ